MSRPTAAVVAWSLVAISAVLGFAGTGMAVSVEGVDGWHFVANDGLAIAIFLVSAVVGGLVASRLPSNPIGWIFVGLVVSLGLAGGADGYVVLSLDDDRLGGVVPWAAWYSSNAFLAFFAMLVLTLLLFPNGRLLTRRWRVVLWTVTAGLLLVGASGPTEPGTLDDYPRLDEPGRHRRRRAVMAAASGLLPPPRSA